MEMYVDVRHTHTLTQSNITEGLIVIAKQRDSNTNVLGFFFVCLFLISWQFADMIHDCNMCLNNAC